MRKRQIAIIPLIFASMIMLLSSIMPHHHHGTTSNQLSQAVSRKNGNSSKVYIRFIHIIYLNLETDVHAHGVCFLYRVIEPTCPQFNIPHLKIRNQERIIYTNINLDIPKFKFTG